MKKMKHVADCVKSDELVQFTQGHDKISNVLDPEKKGANEEATARKLTEYLIREGFKMRLEKEIPGRPNEIAFLRGKIPGKTILFEGHTDVVTAAAICAAESSGRCIS